MIADPAKSTLIIVESPTKANTISKYLPSSCTVIASKGHVVELAPNPTTGVYGVDVDNGYALEYVIEDEKKKVLAEMKKALKGKEQLILATDEDREGESISWQLLNQLKPECPVYRMVFHEITRQAITKAFSSCREIDMNLVAAQEARRTVDRLQGYGISPMLSRKLGGRYSAGRVQSPGLKLIVEREKIRRAFVSSGYCSVEATLSSGNSVFPAVLTAIDDKQVASSKSYDKETGRIKDGVIQLDRENGERIASEIMEGGVSILSISYRDILSQPAKPFTTSTLQQDASRKLRKGVREIMAIAQTLYENGFITYMRTDSPTLSQECINASRMQVEEMFGQDYLSYKPRNYKATGGNAGIIVNGATATIGENVDVSGNTFGGIEVSKGTGEGLGDAQLTVTSAITNTTEAYGKPTVWTDGEGAIVIDQTGMTQNSEVKEGQVQYYIEAENASE